MAHAECAWVVQRKTSFAGCGSACMCPGFVSCCDKTPWQGNLVEKGPILAHFQVSVHIAVKNRDECSHNCTHLLCPFSCGSGPNPGNGALPF